MDNKKKKCSKCELEKFLVDFGKNAKSSDGLRYQCKACDTKSRYKLFGTYKGFLTKIYSDQNNNSKKRGHPAPSYTKEELGVWLFNRPNFDNLFQSSISECCNGNRKSAGGYTWEFKKNN